MIEEERFRASLGPLIAWLETWRTDDGGYNGFVIHRTEAKRMKRIHDTAWTQAAMIQGYANLYEKSQEVRWHDALVVAADLQYSRYQEETGKYLYAGHEDDRFCSLVHCALANCALLRAGRLLGPEREQRYIQAVRGNVDEYWMPKLWVEREGAFRFSEIDYYSPNEDRYVINFNTMAAKCLLDLASITGDDSFKETALTIGRWLVKRCDHARRVHAEMLRALPEENRMPPGGLPYQFTPSQRDPENCVSLYAGLALRGICALYEATGEEEYARIAEETAEFLLSMRDPKSRLFFHTTKQGRIVPYPQFIAGAGMILLGIREAGNTLGQRYSLDDTLATLLSYQYSNGSFPSFIGKDRYTGRWALGAGVVWEDVVATVNWNAQLFEYLTQCVADPSLIRIERARPSLYKVSSRFFYVDSPCQVWIVSWYPPKSWGAYVMRKTHDQALVAVEARSIYGSMVEPIRRLVGRRPTLRNAPGASNGRMPGISSKME